MPRLLLAALLPLLTVACGATEPRTRVVIEGTVADAAGGIPVAGAAVTLFEMEFKSGRRLATASTDAAGRYDLRYEFDGRCPESLLLLTAAAVGYEEAHASRLMPHAGAYPQCTEGAQRIDIALLRTGATP
jgi:hypothetical protein